MDALAKLLQKFTRFKTAFKLASQIMRGEYVATPVAEYEPLQLAERRYRALFEQSQDAIFIIGLDGIYQDANKQAGKLLGCPVAAMIGTHYKTLFPTEPLSSQQTLTLLTTGRTLPVFERLLRRPNGEIIEVEVSLSLVRDRNGRPLHLQSAVRDVSRRKRVQEELQMLQRIDKELGYTLDVQRVVSMTLDAATRRTEAETCVIGWIDEETRQLRRLGYLGETDFLAEPINLRELYNPNSPYDVAQVFQQNTPLLSTRLPQRQVQLILPLITASDTRGVILLESPDVSAFHDANRQYLLYLARRTATALDNIGVHMKTQHHAEQMDVLYQFGHTLAGTTAAADVQHTLTQGLGMLLKATSAFYCEYDHHSQQVTPTATYQLSEAKDAIDSIHQFTDYAELITQVSVDLVQVRQSSASAIPAATRLMQQLGVQTLLLLPVLQDKNLIGFIGVCESRAERYFSRDELTLALNLTSQALLALQRARLIQHLQDAEQIKSEMIRMASHDLRNPLAQVKGYVELFRGAAEPTPLIKDYIAGAERGITKMERLLIDILNLERAESQKTDHWQPLRLLPLLQEIAYGFHDQAQLKNQRLEAHFPPDIPPINGSEIQLQQTFTNLIDNAIKYTPENGQINIAARVENNRLIFEVRDTGYGIPKDRQERVFQRFYRAQTPGTETIAGTGLGLSLVKTVVQRHGGDVFFSSEEGRGSTFGCWFPLLVTEQPSLVIS